MTDARRIAVLLLLLTAIAVGIYVGVWLFDEVTG